MGCLGHIEVHPTTLLRRKAKARQEAAQTHAAAVLDRLQWQVVEMRASLERAAVAHAVMARELGTN